MNNSLIFDLTAVVQHLKPELEEGIVSAALEVFSASGYAAATMADIAKAAGISTGNLYHYFARKEELFHAVIPQRFVARFEKLLRKRIQALSGVENLRKLSPEAEYHLAAEELLRFTIEERRRVVLLFARSEGTPYEGFADRTVQHLVKLAIDYAKSIRPKLELTPAARFALDRIYRGFLATMVAILEQHEDEAEIRARVESFATYHLAGLKGFFER